VLPYLPLFGQYFSPLPQAKSDVTFGVTTIPAKLIECVTQSLINYNMPVSLLNSKQVRDVLAREEILPLCETWTWKDWDECDWSKIKDLSIRSLFDERAKQAKEVVEKACLECPQFLKHFTKQHDEWLIKENIAQLRQLMSDQNLRLLPDYEQRVEVLKELGFIDDGLRVELKGKVACEVSGS
jgi:antiviral helicase SKI2